MTLGVANSSEGLYIAHPVSTYAPVVQLDRILDYESRGRRFESFRVRHLPSSEALFNPPTLKAIITINNDRHFC